MLVIGHLGTEPPVVRNRTFPSHPYCWWLREIVQSASHSKVRITSTPLCTSHRKNLALKTLSNPSCFKQKICYRSTVNPSCLAWKNINVIALKSSWHFALDDHFYVIGFKVHFDKLGTPCPIQTCFYVLIVQYLFFLVFFQFSISSRLIKFIFESTSMSVGPNFTFSRVTK